jgi:ribosomal protein S27AE
MAQEYRFVCGKCDHIIEAWDDGNPYYVESVITRAGEVKQKKKYAYHPNELRELCIGNDAEHLYLSCKKEFMVDSKAPIMTCPKCKSSEIVHKMDLAGKSCPYCTEGVFRRELGAIS